MRQTVLTVAKFVLARAGIEAGSVENARFAKLAGASSILYAGSAILGMLVTIFLARLLGAAGLGVYAAAFAVITFSLVITNTGVPSVVLRYLPIYLKRGEPRSARVCAIWGFCHVTGGAVVGASVLALVVTASGWLETAVRPTYLAAALLLPLWALLVLQSSVLQGHERAIQARMPDMIVRPAVLILLLLGWSLLAEADVRAPHVAMLLQVVAFLVAVVVGAWLLRPLRRRTSAGPSRRSEIGAWYRMAAALTTTQIAEVAMAQAALLILPLHADPAQLGLFRVALAASALVSLPAMAAAMPLPPMIARLFATGERTTLQSLVTTSARLSLLLCLPIAAAFALAGHTILALLFGGEFAAAYPLLLILTLGQTASVLAGSASWVLRMTGHERYEARSVMVAAVCQVMALLAITPFHGAAGAVVAQSGGLILVSALLIRRAVRCVDLDPTFLGLSGNAQGSRGEE